MSSRRVAVVISGWLATSVLYTRHSRARRVFIACSSQYSAERLLADRDPSRKMVYENATTGRPLEGKLAASSPIFVAGKSNEKTPLV